MLDITHQKARALLQASTDQMLSTEEKSALDAHLVKCKTCSEYAERLARLETRLHKALHAQWDSRQPDLNLKAILHPSQAKLIWNNFISKTHAMGRVTIVAALLLGYVLIANLLGIRLPISEARIPTTIPTPNELSLTHVASPTPSAQFTLTGLSTQACKTVIHIVRTNDSLESIAMQYGTTKEAILEYNNLVSNLVFTGTELAIPLCKSTPSQTATMTLAP